jgi:glycosyltransferase involved in cell wall biosynthesis
MTECEERGKTPLVSIVVPAFNEERTIEEIVRRVTALAMCKEVIAVDDGSRDRTASN